MSDAAVGILRDARGYIERGWAQGDAARDDDGFACTVESRKAVRWCALGAIGAAGRRFPQRDRDTALTALYRAVGTPTISFWNDSPRRTQADVLAAFDRAIRITAREVKP
ncbi:hypothetical protein ATO13_23301 [Stappia sp. 22II-S9-Z10]|nr:hypothetical protein ATO13_23301 [Stappia sp. 22II-S9-Z10]